MTATTTRSLAVPGASLAYEVRGSGPVLLLIPGGPADSTTFDGVADLLAADFTVVTYDPRGLSRSTLDDPGQEISVEVQADDAHRLLSAVGPDPAYVFGSSGGGTTGLCLVAQHPGQVRVLVAHEPPVTSLLPGEAELRAQIEDVYDTYRNAGAGPAMGKFLAFAGFRADPPPDPPPSDPAQQPPPDPQTAAASARWEANLELFLGQMMRSITGYLPDVTALRATAPKVIVATGTASAGQTAHRAALALAGQLGVQPADFPGDHSGFAGQPAEFVELLHRTLIETP